MPTKQAFAVHCNLFYPHLQTLTQQVRNALSSEQMLEQLQTHDCDLDLDNFSIRKVPNTVMHQFSTVL